MCVCVCPLLDLPRRKEQHTEETASGEDDGKPDQLDTEKEEATTEEIHSCEISGHNEMSESLHNRSEKAETRKKEMPTDCEIGAAGNDRTTEPSHKRKGKTKTKERDTPTYWKAGAVGKEGTTAPLHKRKGEAKTKEKVMPTDCETGVAGYDGTPAPLHTQNGEATTKERDTPAADNGGKRESVDSKQMQYWEVPKRHKRGTPEKPKKDIQTKETVSKEKIARSKVERWLEKDVNAIESCSMETYILHEEETLV